MDAAALHDVFVGIMCQSQLEGMRLDPCESHLHTLLENITKLAGKLDASVSGHVRNFDEQDASLAAGRVCNETSDNAGAAMLLRDLFVETFNAENLLQIIHSHNRVIRL